MGGFQGSMKFKGLSYYSASKAALACLSECLANEFADSNISVNCLALGAVQTEMLEEAFPGYKAPVTAKEMAGFISYFAINGHKFYNGKILPVAVSTP
jgi:NAD(P)-dependent dehydrogenase (short-subunit alcohol dehydrogenase family)